jgi:hypothetical protein
LPKANNPVSAGKSKKGLSPRVKTFFAFTGPYLPLLSLGEKANPGWRSAHGRLFQRSCQDGPGKYRIFPIFFSKKHPGPGNMLSI